MRGDEGEEINRLYNPPARAPPSGSWMHGMDSWCMTEQGAQDGNSRNRIMKKPELSLTVEKYFEDREESRSIFDVVRAAVTEAGPSEMRVTKSQISFRRRRAFAWVWIPEKYLRRKSATGPDAFFNAAGSLPALERNRRTVPGSVHAPLGINVAQGCGRRSPRMDPPGLVNRRMRTKDGNGI
jgi:hypothetical protein